MKRLLFLLLTLTSLALAQGFNAYQSTTFSSNTSGASVVERTIIGYHQLSWTVSGTVTGCSVTLDSSADGSSWSSGGIITAQTCTTSGNSSVTAGSANYVRVTMASWAGTGSVTVVYKGWVNNPSGGSVDLSSPGAIGGTTPAAGTFTTLTGTKIVTNAEYDNGTCTTSKTITPVNGNRQKVTLTNGQTCALTFTQPSSGTVSVQLRVIQSTTSSYNGAISGCKWPSGTTPTITATTGAIDVVSAYLDGTNAYCVATQDFR